MEQEQPPPPFPPNRILARKWLNAELRSRGFTKCAGDNARLDMSKLTDPTTGNPLFPGKTNVHQLRYKKNHMTGNDFWQAFARFYPEAARCSIEERRIHDAEPATAGIQHAPPIELDAIDTLGDFDTDRLFDDCMASSEAMVDFAFGSGPGNIEKDWASGNDVDSGKGKGNRNNAIPVATAVKANLADPIPAKKESAGKPFNLDAPKASIAVFSGVGTIDHTTIHQTAPLLKTSKLYVQCEEAVHSIGMSLSELWDECSSDAEKTRLTADKELILQLCMQICAFDLWCCRGASFDAVVGHSTGELAAACVSGRIAIATAFGIALKLSLVAQSFEGGMAFGLLDGTLPEGCHIAAKNFEDDQGRAFGSICSMDAALLDKWVAFQSETHPGYAAGRIHTAHPWHSPMYEPLASSMELNLELTSEVTAKQSPTWPSTWSGCGASSEAEPAKVAPDSSSPSAPIFISTVTGAVEDRCGPEHWKTWLHAPVEMAKAMETVCAIFGDTVDVVVEIGAHPVLFDMTVFLEPKLSLSTFQRKSDPAAWLACQMHRLSSTYSTISAFALQSALKITSECVPNGEVTSEDALLLQGFTSATFVRLATKLQVELSSGSD
jgi:hypothetical protein